LFHRALDLLACPYGERYSPLNKGVTVNKKKLGHFVRSWSQVFLDNGKGSGVFIDWTDSEIYMEFADMTIEEIAEDIIRIEANCLKIMTEDLIEAYKDEL